MQRSCLILFRSLTYAQRGRLVLERSGITATVRKAPAAVTDRGCAYGLKLRTDRLSQALTALKTAGADHGRVFEYQPDGTLREVRA